VLSFEGQFNLTRILQEQFLHLMISVKPEPYPSVGPVGQAWLRVQNCLW